MANEIKHQIKLSADLSSLQQDMQRVSEVLKRLGQEVINIQMKVNGRDVSEVLNEIKGATGVGGSASGAPGNMMGASTQKMEIPAAVSMEKVSEAAKKFARELDSLRDKQVRIVTAIAEATDAQKQLLTKELERTREQERNVRSFQQALGGGAGGGAGAPGNMMSRVLAAVSPTALIGAVGTVASAGFDFPVEMMRTRAARAGISARDIGAAQSLGFDDVLRLSGEARDEARAGQRSGIVRNMSFGAGGGAAAGALLGSIIPGVGTAIGAGVGALGGMGYNMMRGSTERAGITGFEDAMSNIIGARAVDRARFNGAMSLNSSMMPVMQSFGMGGFGRFGGALSSGAGMGFSQGETATGILGLGAAGGAGFANGSNMLTMQRLARGSGMGMGELSQMLVGAGGANGPGLETLTKALSEAVKQGFNTSEQLKRYLDATLQIAQQTGGGAGAAGFGGAASAMQATTDVMGAQGATPGAAANFEGLFNRMQTSNNGFLGVSNFTSAMKILRKNKGFGSMSSRMQSMLPIVLANMSPAMMRDPATQKLLGAAGVDNPEDMTIQLTQERAAAGFEMFPFGTKEGGNRIRSGEAMTPEDQMAQMMATGDFSALGMNFGGFQRSRIADERNRVSGFGVDENGQISYNKPGGLGERGGAVMGGSAMRLLQSQQEAQLAIGQSGQDLLESTVGQIESRGGGAGIAGEVLQNLDQVTKSATANIEKVGVSHGEYNEILKETIRLQREKNALMGSSESSEAENMAQGNNPQFIGPVGQ